VRTGKDGLVYVMDFNNHRLRRIGADGRVATIAGNGVHALAVAGAVASGSPLENPVDFGFDDGRLVFIAYHDPRVLQVDDTGAIEVLAGTPDLGDDGDTGPALQAHFTQLANLAIGKDGTIFVSDDKAHRVRAIRNGKVEAVAGSSGIAGYRGDGELATKALLAEPQALALDGDGRLYLADSANHVIRRIDAEGIIATIAGTGKKGLSGDGGEATQALLNRPRGVAIAPDGTVYLADSGNHRIRRIDRDGIITTVAGTTRGASGDGGSATLAQLDGPNYLEVSDDRILITDQRNHRARVIFLR
jgi:sugar lactone lactonase YvrE